MDIRWFHKETGEKVLQVRYREGPMGEDWWSPWYDVRTWDERDGSKDT